MLLQAQTVGAIDGEVRCVGATQLLERAALSETTRRSMSDRDFFSAVVGGAAVFGGLCCLAAETKIDAKAAKTEAAESQKSQDGPEEARAPEPEEEEDADVHMMKWPATAPPSSARSRARRSSRLELFCSPSSRPPSRPAAERTPFQLWPLFLLCTCFGATRVASEGRSYPLDVDRNPNMAIRRLGV